MGPFKKVCNDLPLRAELILPGTRPTVPSCPTWTHSWIWDETLNRFYKGNMNVQQDPPIQLEVCSFLPVQLQRRTKHFTSVMPPFSHSSEATQGQCFGSGIRSCLVARERTVVNTNCLVTPGDHRPLTFLTEVSSPILENEVNYSEVTYTPRKSKHTAETYCWKQQLSTKAAGVSILCCAAWLSALRAQLNLGCVGYDNPWRCT